ncbi:hypothetical protein BV898_15882 [Hypsibius exemplaris]|uniref:Uncharacterized protein n=1 Tax=Hypsibius exemplaris TaxID=2072580 RepID=A0A9X6NKZ6_HYPEX|nr:hypothetical protein BV898_15882 [Hypsibius exemplaris]
MTVGRPNNPYDLMRASWLEDIPTNGPSLWSLDKKEESGPMTIGNWFIRLPDMLDMSHPVWEDCEAADRLVWSFPEQHLEWLRKFAPP